MALVENDCGCKIDYDLVGHGSMTDLGLYKNIRIVYCPTHAAAPIMLKMLRVINHWHSKESSGKYVMLPPIIKDVQTAIALTEKE